MTDEPYRWLEAMGNRREYVASQLQGAAPVFAASLPEGILLLGLGTGDSKIFEIFDRHALAGLGHPADLERLRLALIDAAHLESFTRAPQDVALRRLVGFGLGPQLKTAFEQIFSPPFIARLLLAEVGSVPSGDLLVRVHFDGQHQAQSGGVAVVAADESQAESARAWLADVVASDPAPVPSAHRMLECAWCLARGLPPGDPSARGAWPKDLAGKTVEAALLRRGHPRAAFIPIAIPLPAPS